MTATGIRRGGAIRIAIYAAVLVLATLAVYLATRGGTATTPSSVGHVHGATAAARDTAKAVKISPVDARRIGVTYATAKVGPLSREIRTVGQVTFDEQRLRTISPRVDGWVDRLYVNTTGQYVTAGQPLLTIYSPMLVSAQEELLLAKKLQDDVAGASEEARVNAADLLASARRRLAYWDIAESEIAEIERSGQVQRTLMLRASSSGYVLEKNVLAGQKIMAGDALFKLADLSRVWVEGEVFEQDIPEVHVGQAVNAEFEALPGRPHTGRISYVYPTLDPQTRTARVRVILPNDDLWLKPGMYATMRIAGTGRPAVLTVPRTAVLSTGERSIVFVRHEDGSLVPHEVALGATTDERVEILRGLSAGATVVSSATFLVDAESNLGTALGGMGNMPGMEMNTPPKQLEPEQAGSPKRTAAPAAKPAPDDDRRGMPGMQHPAPAGHRDP